MSSVQGSSYLPPPDVAWALSGTALYVANISAFCLATYCFLLTRRSQRFPITLAAASVGAVVLSTCIWATQIVVAVTLPRLRTASSNIDIPDPEPATDVPDGNPTPEHPTDILRRAFVMYTLSYLGGNIITGINLISFVNWPIWAIATMSSLLLANVGTGSASFLACRGAEGTDSCDPLQFVSLLLCLTFNAVATTLFVRVARCARPMWRTGRAAAHAGRRSHNRGDLTLFFARPLVVKILTIALVSLGCVYLALGIARLYQIAGYRSYSLNVIHGVLYQWVGLYPTAVSALLRLIILNSPGSGSRIVDDPKRSAVGGATPGVPNAYPMLPLPMRRGQATAAKEKLLRVDGSPREAETARGAGAEQSAGSPAADAARPRRWRAVHQAARGAGISPEALLASISLVQHPELLRERYEGTMPPRYEG